MKNPKKIYLIIRLVTAGLAALLTLLWFLPVVKVFGESFTMMDALELYGSKDANAGFVLFVIACALPIIWALIPKIWSAIIGIIAAIIPLILCSLQVKEWKSHDLDMTFSSGMMIPVAVLLLISSIAVLAFAILARKKNQQIA